MTRPEPQLPGTEPSPVIDLTQPFTEKDLYTLRAAVIAHAHAGGAAPSSVDSLLIAVGELASNAVRHGGGAGTLRLWLADDRLVCQVRDQGPGIADPERVGREAVPPTASGGRGLWIVRRLCPEMTIDSDDTGTVVTVAVPIHRAPEP
jgi:anti-sigma regulatory factor (Ser/Thr protein kinase)